MYRLSKLQRIRVYPKTAVHSFSQLTSGKVWPIENKYAAELHETVYNTVTKLKLWDEFHTTSFDRRILHNINYTHYYYVKSVVLHISTTPISKGHMTDALMDVQFIVKNGWDNYSRYLGSNIADRPYSAKDWPNVFNLDKNALHDTYEVVNTLKMCNEFSSINFDYVLADKLLKDTGYFPNIMTHPRLSKYDEFLKLRCLLTIKFISHFGWKEFCFFYKS